MSGFNVSQLQCPSIVNGSQVLLEAVALAVGCWLYAAGWLLVGCWLLAAGSSAAALAAGCWLYAAGWQAGCLALMSPNCNAIIACDIGKVQSLFGRIASVSGFCGSVFKFSCVSKF